MEKKMIKGMFGAILLVIGVVLNVVGIGKQEFMGMPSVGAWLVIVGAVALVLAAVTKERKVDERMLHVAGKANRWTFIGIVLFAFIIMILDGIKPIAVSYWLFMSYFICGIVFYYLIAYKLLLKYN